MQALMKGFRTFLLRGNLVDMAVRDRDRDRLRSLVTALITDLITPIIAASSASPTSRGFVHDPEPLPVRRFPETPITFVSIAAAVFLVVKPVDMLMARPKTEPPVDETVRQCPECLSEIPTAARRCAFCTAQPAPAT